MNAAKWLSTAIMTGALTGCIVVADPDDWHGDYDDNWEYRQKVNREYIADLRLGVPLSDVRAELGRADYSEAWRNDAGSEVVVLRYRTHHRRSDGDTTEDETTALVFVDGQLTRWGAEGVTGN